MKIYKVFEREEIQDALEKAGFTSDDLWDLWDLLDNSYNDVAVPWCIESPYEDDPVYQKNSEIAKVINEYMISKGCSIDEDVYIDMTWY